MRIHSSLFLLGAAGVLSAAGATAAEVDTSAWKCRTCPFPKGASGVVEAGLGAVSDASARFGDFTGLQREGGHLILGGAVNYRGEDGTFADLKAADLGLDSRTLAGQTGREGRYTLHLGYAEVPRHLADDAVSPFLGNGTGVLSLPAGFRAGSTAAMPLAGTLRPVELGFKRSRLDAGISWVIGPHWTTGISARHDVRDGTQRTAGSFFSTTAQLAAPVDQVTDQFEVSASYVGRRLQATLAYQASLFRNGADSLTWANPFLPVVPGSDRGQLALAPDNQFHQLLASAGYEIGPRIRASADVAVGRMTQDAAYLAPTLNVDPLAGLPAATDLPAQSLRGRVDTFNAGLRLTATPLDALRLHASYARDVRDNRTPRESYPAVSTDMFLSATPRSNRPSSAWQDRFKLSADYRGPGSVKTSIGAEHDRRQRSYQEVVYTRETTLWGQLAVQPRDDLSLALKLAHAERRPSSYGIAQWVEPPQNPLLRKYDLAQRTRDSAGLRADLTLGEKVSVGVSADYANDDYGQSAIGLTQGRSLSFGADVAVAFSERTRLHLFAQTERIRSDQAGSQVYGPPDWTARNQDKFGLLGVGIRHAVIVDRLDAGADLTFSRSDSDVTVQTGATEPLFPTATTKLDGLKLYANYKLDDRWWLTASYWYERYDAQDWRVDGLLPGTVPNLLGFGEQSPRYRVNVVRVALRYRF